MSELGHPKPVRIRDPKLLKAVKTQPCLICRRAPPVDAHHVKSRKAGGHDTADNVMPLCRTHHDEWHRRGIKTMERRYMAIRRWLEKHPVKRTETKENEMETARDMGNKNSLDSHVGEEVKIFGLNNNTFDGPYTLLGVEDEGLVITGETFSGFVTWSAIARVGFQTAGFAKTRVA